MKNDGEALKRLAAQIADGAPIDWEGIESTLPSSEKDVVDNAQVVEKLTRFFVDRNLVGRTWGHLTIRQKIDEGRFGEVFQAWDATLERIVALKLYRPDVAARIGEEEVLKEGRLLARIDHPHIVTVHGADHHQGRIGLWMQHVDGKTLEQHLFESGTLSVEETLEIGLVLCDALAAIHREGLLHRDVKAQNVMLDKSGRLILMDFGLGAYQEQVSNYPAGTPLYMAPELFQGHTASASSDFYALGVLLFHLLTGDFPVKADDLNSLRRVHAGSGRREGLDNVPRALPTDLRTLIDELLNPNPSTRPHSAEEIGRHLANLHSDRSTNANLSATRLQFQRRSTPDSWISKQGFAASLVLNALALVVLAWFSWQSLIHQGHLLEGQRYYNRGDIRLAITSTRSALGVMVTARGSLQLARYLLAAGHFQEAFDTITRAHGLFGAGSAPDELRIRAQYYFDRLDYGSALEAYLMVAQEEDDDAYSWRQIAQIHDLLESPNLALEAIDKAIDADPSVLNQGQRLLLLASTDPKGALKQSNSMLEEDPDANYFYWAQGMAFLGLDQVSDALEAFKNLEGSKDAAFGREARLHQAQCLTLLGKLSEAQYLLIELSPEAVASKAQRADWTATYFLARINFLRSDTPLAERRLGRLKDLPEIPRSLRRLRDALILALRMESPELVQEFKRKMESIIDKYPSKTGSAYLGQVDALRSSPESSKERAVSLDVIRHDLSDPSLTFSWARASQAAGNCEVALHALEKLHKQKVKLFEYNSATLFIEARLIEAECHLEFGDLASARKAFDPFLSRLDPEALNPELSSRVYALRQALLSSD